MGRNKNNDLNLIKQAANIYGQKLLNKNILFIFLKNNKVNFYEVTFLEEHFKHLTGVKTTLNAYEFFYRAKNNRLKITEFDYKDSTTALKLDNLIKSMILNSYAKMIGEFKQNKVYLSVSKIAGNNNLIIGFDEGEKINYPKTLLKGDIRDYTEEKPCRIIGIFSKSILEKQYKEITYLASNVTINRFFTNEQLNKLISKDEIFSENENYKEIIEKNRKLNKEITKGMKKKHKII